MTLGIERTVIAGVKPAVAQDASRGVFVVEVAVENGSTPQHHFTDRAICYMAPVLVGDPQLEAVHRPPARDDTRGINPQGLAGSRARDRQGGLGEPVRRPHDGRQAEAALELLDRGQPDWLAAIAGEAQ